MSSTTYKVIDMRAPNDEAPIMTTPYEDAARMMATSLPWATVEYADPNTDITYHVAEWYDGEWVSPPYPV